MTNRVRAGVEPFVQSRVQKLLLVMACFFLLITVRLYQLQVLRGNVYLEKTYNNVVHRKAIPALRGQIRDRHGAFLAVNRPVFNIYVEPSVIRDSDLEKLFRVLELTGAERQEMREEIEVAKQRVLVFSDKAVEPGVTITDGKNRASIVLQQLDMDGVEVEVDRYRYYPYGKIAGQLVGYVNQLSANEYEQCKRAGCLPHEPIGRAGVEALGQHHLRGSRGKHLFVTDADGDVVQGVEAEKLLRKREKSPAMPGHRIDLTIDIDFQQAVERAVQGVPAAGVVVLEVETGRVLALVSTPKYDPNIMAGSLSRAEHALLVQDPRKPFLDKTLQMHYPPGSTFKFVSAIAALEEGVVDEHTKHTCHGAYSQEGERFKCTATHGAVDLSDALKVSCNVYFWKLAEKVGMDKMAAVAKRFGFGKRTGLGLNGDMPGRVPSRAWYEEQGQFRIGFTLNAATGQGDVEVTVMQLALAYAALVNGGTLWVPQIVERVTTVKGETVLDFAPRKRTQVAELRVLNALRSGMLRAVNERGGTAFRKDGKMAVTMLGKTGTAQVRSKRNATPEFQGWHPHRNHAWFAGAAPAESPKIVVVVLAEHGGAGGRVAGPIARKIVEAYFRGDSAR